MLIHRCSKRLMMLRGTQINYMLSKVMWLSDYPAPNWLLFEKQFSASWNQWLPNDMYTEHITVRKTSLFLCFISNLWRPYWNLSIISMVSVKLRSRRSLYVMSVNNCSHRFLLRHICAHCWVDSQVSSRHTEFSKECPLVAESAKAKVSLSTDSPFWLSRGCSILRLPMI